MAKRNIEHDLLKILKSKEGDEILYTIFKMANGKYKYEFKYLNKIPYNEMMVHLEKVIVLGAKRDRILDDLEDSFDTILEFANNIRNIRYRDIDKKSLMAIKYDLMLAKEKVKTSIKRSTTGQRFACLFLSGVIFCTMYVNALDKSNSSEIIDTSLEITIEDSREPLDNNIAYEKMETDSTEKKSSYENLSNAPMEIEVLDVIKKEEIRETSEEQIMRIYGLKEEEFNVLCAIAMTEAKTNSYEDTYAVINTIYNRTISKNWIDYISDFHGIDVGRSLYYQAITPGQFVVYENGRYAMNLGIREGDSYQAVIDFLLSKKIKHDYLSFRSSDTELADYEQFVPNGNKYFNLLLVEDRVEEEEINNVLG